jgi:hypothetical protein
LIWWDLTIISIFPLFCHLLAISMFNTRSLAFGKQGKIIQCGMQIGIDKITFKRMKPLKNRKW